MIKKYSIFQEYLERFLPWLVLVILAMFTYARFFEIPYVGFVISNNLVRLVYVPHQELSDIKMGDRIIQFGSIKMAQYSQNLNMPLADEIDKKDSVAILIERNGAYNWVNWSIPDRSVETILTQALGLWWLSYILWSGGTATLLFHRPKDGFWIRLVSLYYLLAIIIAVGTGPSSWHIWKGATVFRSAIWLGFPLVIHFHWEFPRTLKKLPTIVWILFYTLGIFLAIAEWFQTIPSHGYLLGVYPMIGGTILLLVVHYLVQEDQRKKLALLNDAFFISAFPTILVKLSDLSDIYPPFYIIGGTFLALPGIIGAYFFVNYWDQILSRKQTIVAFFQKYLWLTLVSSGAIILLALLELFLEITIPTATISILIIFLSLIAATISFSPFLVLPTLPRQRDGKKIPTREIRVRANRMISTILFVLIIGLVYSLIVVNGIVFLDHLFASIFIGVGSALSAVLLTLFGYSRFKEWIERKLLGIDIQLFDILQSYIDGLASSIDRTNLKMLLSEKILPSLLIRQSAMIYIIDGHPYTLFSIGVDEDQIPTSPEIVNIFSKSADKQSEFTIRTDYYAWINLTLPLQIDQKTIGLWLLGKKDPDDLYNSEEISILTSIANQTAIALAKIQHKEQLNALLQENIYRAEEERKKLARDLHDDILNGLVVLGMTLDENQVSLIFEKQFSFLTNRIRRMITGLRPPSLDQGLWFALKEKSDELQLHTNGEILIDFDVPFSETRYHHNIEGQIFRIVQQACDNALFHAQAKNIRLKGELTPDMIIINVEDDGKGFILDDQHQDKKEDQNSEIKHYGLAIMRERAELIGADLSIQSVLGQGTRIQLALKSIIYQKDEHQARIKAEKALHEREKSYRELLTTASYGILINNESDRMIFANEQAARISGYSILELLNLTIEDLATSDEYQKIKAFRQNKKEEAKYSNPLFETHLQKKSGEIIPIEMTVTQTIWEGKRVGMAFFADIREKKRIENALKQSEENTYKIFDNAIDGIVLVDASGKHLYVNKRFAEMVDYSVSELLKKSMKDIVHDESMEELSSRLKDRFSGSNPTMPFEIKIKKKDGTVLPIIGISTKIKWQGKDAVMGFMRDLSIQRQAEEELRQTENKFRILIENARDGILVADQSGKYIYSNSRAAEIFGYESNELPNLSYPDIIHPDHIGEIEKEIFSTKEFESIPIHRESKIITKSGIILTVEYSAFPTIWEGKRGFLFIFRDISAIINAQENLRISEEKFKAIVDNANDGILVANPNGKHIYANTRASEITGYPIDELLKTTINDLAHPEEFPAIKERFNARLAGQLTPRQYSTRILTKEGISKDIEITAARTSWNNHPAIIVIIRDPSERN